MENIKVISLFSICSNLQFNTSERNDILAMLKLFFIATIKKIEGDAIGTPTI